MNKRRVIYAILHLAYWTAVILSAWGAKTLDEPYKLTAFWGMVGLTLPLGFILLGIYVHVWEGDYYPLSITFALINSCVIGCLIVWLRTLRKQSNSDSLK